MKQLFSLALSLLLGSASLFAQGEMDAIRLSQNDLTGTARAIGMGGAFGALGGDISGVNINPAGIAVYKSSEVVTSLNFRNNKTETKLNAGSVDKSRFQLDFDNLAFVGVFPLENDIMPTVNFGFSYNKIKNFDRKYNSRGNNLGSSLTDYMAQRATNSNPIVGSDPYQNSDWLGTLGYEGYLIDQIDANDPRKGYKSILNIGEKVGNDLYVREKGSISSYDFNVGTTFADILSVGITLAVTDVDYRTKSSYQESFEEGGYFDLINYLKTEGQGFQTKVGFILKPMNELRIGVAYHSPTWYEMTDYYYADLYSENFPTGKGPWAETPEGATDYTFKTPDKWAFSLASVIGGKMILSADYEWINYKGGMRYRDTRPGDALYDANTYIKEDFKNASTLRVGAEYRVTPQLSARVGYAWIESPFGKELKNNQQAVVTSGTIPHYVIDGDANHFTYGFGYKFTPNIYADLAFVMKNQKSTVYSFSKMFDDFDDVIVDNKDHRASLKNNTFNALVTLGYRF